MSAVPGLPVRQAELAAGLADAIGKLRKEDISSVVYSLGNDSTGEPSIFFRIVLTDEASVESRLALVTGRVATTLFDSIRPNENWGLNAYFNFRSRAEQLKRNDREWS